MDKKRRYIQPSVCVVMLDSHGLLQIASPDANPPRNFVDDSNWEWDKEGGN